MKRERAVKGARAHFVVVECHRDRLVDLQRLLRVAAPGFRVAGAQAQLAIIAAFGSEVQSFLHRLLRAVPVLQPDLRVRFLDHACDARHRVFHRGEIVVEAVHGVLEFPELRAASREEEVVFSERLFSEDEFGQEFFRTIVLSALIGLLAEPADHVARSRLLSAVLLVKCDLLLGPVHVLKIVEARDEPERAALEELLVELARLVEVRRGLFVILFREFRARDPVVRLRLRRGGGKFLQQNLERLRHARGVAELAVDQREIFEAELALLRLRMVRHERREILLRRRVLLELHLRGPALRERGGHLCVHRKIVQECRERLHRLVVVPELHPAPAELEDRLALEVFRQRLRPADDDLVDRRGVLEVTRLEQRLRLHQRNAVHLCRSRVLGEECIRLVHEPRVGCVVEHHEPRVARLARLRGRGKFLRNLRVSRERLVALPHFALRIGDGHEDVQLALELHAVAGTEGFVAFEHALVVLFVVEDAKARDGDHILPRCDLGQRERGVESLCGIVGASEFHL